MKTFKTFLGIVLAVGMVSLTTATVEAGQPGFGMKSGGGHSFRGGVRTGGGQQIYGKVRTVGNGINRTRGVGGLGILGGLGYGGYGGYAPYSIFGGGAFNGGLPYLNGQIPIPPYFALHPPVYYSAPVARSYGYSPYSYPGYVPTPPAPVTMAEPQAYVNPYCPAALEKLEKVQEQQEQQAETDEFASKPQWIRNPFVRTFAPEVVEQAPVVANN